MAFGRSDVGTAACPHSARPARRRRHRSRLAPRRPAAVWRRSPDVHLISALPRSRAHIVAPVVPAASSRWPSAPQHGRGVQRPVRWEPRRRATVRRAGRPSWGSHPVRHPTHCRLQDAVVPPPTGLQGSGARGAGRARPPARPTALAAACRRAYSTAPTSRRCPCIPYTVRRSGTCSTPSRQPRTAAAGSSIVDRRAQARRTAAARVSAGGSRGFWVTWKMRHVERYHVECMRPGRPADEGKEGSS